MTQVHMSDNGSNACKRPVKSSFPYARAFAGYVYPASRLLPASGRHAVRPRRCLISSPPPPSAALALSPAAVLYTLSRPRAPLPSSRSPRPRPRASLPPSTCLPPPAILAPPAAVAPTPTSRLCFRAFRRTRASHRHRCHHITSTSMFVLRCRPCTSL